MNRAGRFRPVAAVSALVAGAAGLAANAFLVGYYVLARPWQPGHDGPWEWLGSANDLVGALASAATIPVVGYLVRRVPGDRLLGGFGVAAVLGSAAMAAAGPMLVAGAITLQTQFVVAGVALPVLFGWLWRASVAARRHGVLPRRTARLGELIGAIALGATTVAGVGALLPAGSTAQYVLVGVAAVPGLLAYLAYPAWQLLAGRAWWRGEPARWSADQSRVVGGVSPGLARE